MSRVTGAWLHQPEAQAVFAMLTNAGFQVFAVGGCVRNELLGVPVADVDMATDAQPEIVVQLANKAGLHPVPTGIDHGTITVVSQGVGFEVTTFRRDIETDGRRARVIFAKTLAEDARRRDFTMNALYASPLGDVVDPLGGLADIANRKVRFIDDAHERIREDYLRILRFFRFHAWFGDPAEGIDPDALAACAELAEGLDGLSKERIGAEMRKLLNADDPAPSVAAMAQTGILARLLPGSACASLPVLVHLEQQFGLSPDWIRRLACLGGQDHTENLRLSKADRRCLAVYLDLLADVQPMAELAYRQGAVAAQNIMLLRSAVLGAALPNNMISESKLAAAHKFPVKAADLGSEYRGAAIGIRLSQLETKWIASGFMLGKQDLLA